MSDDPLAPVKKVLASFTPDDQVALYRFLARRLGRTPRPMKAIRMAPAKADRVPRVTTRQEMIRCGSPDCKCARGDLHGPYVYEYWREGGRLRKRYAGKPKIIGPTGTQSES